MSNNYELALQDNEYRELEELVAAQERDENMELFAFRKLCPSGEEFAFDPEMCAIYQSLERKGLIQGAAIEEIENGYVFFGLTELGMNLVLQRGAEFSFPAADPQAEDGGVGLADVLVNRELFIATAAISLVAGIVGGFIGAGIFTALT